MTDAAIALTWPFLAGVAIGAFYFGLLWLTVNQLPTTRHPGLLLLLSMGVRLAVSIVGFYRVAGGRGDRLLACLAGFIGIRVLLVSRIRPRLVSQADSQAEHRPPGTPAATKGGESPASHA